MAEVTASLGSGFATTDMVLNIGPQHPATHGVLRLRLTLDGERIVTCEPIVGYMHRGVEKLFEVRDYRQIIVLANRHDLSLIHISEPTRRTPITYAVFCLKKKKKKKK